VRLAPDTLRLRLILLLGSVLVLAQLVSATLHLSEQAEAVYRSSARHAVERIAGVVRYLDTLSPEARAEAYRVLSMAPLQVSPTEASAARLASPVPAPQRARALRWVLEQRLGTDRPIRLVVHRDPVPVELVRPRPWRGMGPPHGAMPHHPMGAGPLSRAVEVVTQLRDGSGVRVLYGLPEQAFEWPWRLLAGIGLVLLAAVAVTAVAVRWLTGPLRNLAQAADALGRDIGRPPLAETGPREVRAAARAFNAMQARIARFVEERTRLLAAISHDLKTPITRLRLRAELLDDPAQREPLQRDLEEMEGRVLAALAFMRGLDESEPTRPVDVNALVESVQADAQDANMTVAVAGRADAPLPGRADQLRRALVNLVDNACRYGHEATIRVADSPARLTIRVQDRGPGIPVGLLERVFEPFYRIEGSRSREHGGTGLGLPIARDVARAHGGELSLRNRPEGGLEANLVLPR
jgi:signal transduction histidine kinase